MRLEHPPVQALTPYSMQSVNMKDTSLKQLTDVIKSTEDVNQWLEYYDQLTPRDTLAAHCLRRSYCYRYGLTKVDVLHSHIDLWLAWSKREVSLEVASACAVLFAMTLEGGASDE